LSGIVRPSAAAALGSAILAENRIRNHLDVVCALSPFDVDLERWVGALRVGWLPRIIEPIEFHWRPAGNRLGFVGTLDHGPNLEGLILVLDELVRRGCPQEQRIRVVGGSVALGNWLAQTYPHVDYLGALDDDHLRAEAATWNAFLHPIFCHPRGCSTKLAMAISWRIPIVTTTSGHRGYEWQAGGLVVADNPVRFVDRCIEMHDLGTARLAKQEVEKLAAASPKRSDVVAKFSEIVGLSDSASPRKCLGVAKL
jgi:glycosyltransferase involved in cell wall biosynthesis